MTINSLLFALVFSSTANVSVENTNQTSPEWITSITNERSTLIHTSNGINVYGSIVTKNNSSYIELSFENTTPQKIEFIWSILKNDELIMITEDEMGEVVSSLNPNSTFKASNNIFIPIFENESLKDFSVQIKLK